MAQLEKAKVFMSGRSQAIRIPAEFSPLLNAHTRNNHL